MTLTCKKISMNNRFSKSAFLGFLIGFGLTTSGFAATDAGACAANSENRQLDYWLGNWKIGAVGSTGNAHSTVSLSLDKCLAIENWADGKGHEGQNIFGYSADDKSWYGMFADNEGRVHVFTSGKVSAGLAEFEGTSGGSSGAPALNRVTIRRLSSDKVEQIWEKSADHGKTWNVVFRGEYSRANP
jgi:hypothetical protein